MTALQIIGLVFGAAIIVGILLFTLGAAEVAKRADDDADRIWRSMKDD